MSGWVELVEDECSMPPRPLVIDWPAVVAVALLASATVAFWTLVLVWIVRL